MFRHPTIFDQNRVGHHVPFSGQFVTSIEPSSRPEANERISNLHDVRAIATPTDQEEVLSHSCTIPQREVLFSVPQSSSNQCDLEDR